MNYNKNVNDNSKPTNQPKMSSITRSLSMCPTGADSINYSEKFFEECMIMRSQSMSSVVQDCHYTEERVETNVSALETHDETEEPSSIPSGAESEMQTSNKPKILAPPMHYDLHKADAAFVYGHIQTVIKNDEAAINYLETVVKPVMFAQKSPIVFGYIPAPPNTDITRMVIGRDGYFFKMTTACCNVYFIWHELETNTFLFWGPTIFKTVKAMNSIRWRIVKYYEMYKSNSSIPEEEADDDCADMPELISCGNTPDHEHPEQN